MIRIAQPSLILRYSVYRNGIYCYSCSTISQALDFMFLDNRISVGPNNYEVLEHGGA